MTEATKSFRFINALNAVIVSMLIGLFEGVFEDGIMILKPNYVRALQAKFFEQNFAIKVPAKGDSGPGHLVVKDT